MRPHTQLVNIDASWEKGHNRVFFSARNKFLYFIMLKIQQGIQWYHQILSFIAPLLRKRQIHSRISFVGHLVCMTEDQNYFQETLAIGVDITKLLLGLPHA